jgi:DnaJ-domain-containing protein 1
MNDSLVNGLYLLLCAGVGYALFIAGREFVKGVEAAKQEHGARTQGSGRAEPKSRAASGDGFGSSNGTEEQAAARPEGPLGAGPRAWYEVLEVHPNANISEIKVAYRRKIALYHPDRVAGLGKELRELAETRAKEINAAYSLASILRGS